MVARVWHRECQAASYIVFIVRKHQLNRKWGQVINQYSSLAPSGLCPSAGLHSLKVPQLSKTVARAESQGSGHTSLLRTIYLQAITASHTQLLASKRLNASHQFSSSQFIFFWLTIVLRWHCQSHDVIPHNYIAVFWLVPIQPSLWFSKISFNTDKQTTEVN